MDDDAGTNFVVVDRTIKRERRCPIMTMDCDLSSNLISLFLLSSE